MFASHSPHRPGGRHGLPHSPHPSSRSRHEDVTRQERGLHRGSPVYHHASPSPSRHRSRSSSRHPSPSPSRHHVRPHRQHSHDHHVHSRSRPIAMPDYRHNLKSENSSRLHHHPEYVSSRRSEDSVSSSVSSSGSLFDKERSGYASSRTSLEDEADPPKRGRCSPEVRTIRERRLDRSDADHLDGHTPATPEDGNSVWSRVATAAGTLTVSVSKAWAANVNTNSGEDTPPGEESRLFHAMKAYHLGKAKNPSDLPSWLFSEQERRPVGQLRLASRHDNTEETSVQASPLSPRGLRDIYDTAAAATSPGSPRYGDLPTSKAASHLKALRDAKRNVLSPSATSPRREDREEVQQRRRANRRMGMPVMKHGRF